MKHEIIVLGAGITGLTLAWKLKKSGRDVCLLEASNRVGGLINTINQNGFLFELGPHSCRPTGNSKATLDLITELNLESEVLPADPAANQRFLYYNQKLHKVPTGLFEFLISPLTKGISKALWKDFFTPKIKENDLTIYEFLSRRLGHEWTERLIDPVVSGIYAGDIRKLCMQTCFPQIYDLEQKHGSLLKGILKRKKSSKEHFSLFSFKNGMCTLPQALSKALGDSLKTSSVVASLKSDKPEVVLSNGKTIEAEHIFSTLSLKDLSKMLPSVRCNDINYTSVAIVCLGYHKNVLPKKGFGHLVPRQEGENIMGMIWDSAIFPEQNAHPDQTRLSVMMGGSHHPHLCSLSEEKRLEIALNAVSKHLRISTKPDFVYHHIASNAIPQYYVGHLSLVRQLKETAKARYPFLTLLGTAFDGVSINDCIQSATEHAGV